MQAIVLPPLRVFTQGGVQCLLALVNYAVSLLGFVVLHESLSGRKHAEYLVVVQFHGRWTHLKLL